MSRTTRCRTTESLRSTNEHTEALHSPFLIKDAKIGGPLKSAALFGRTPRTCLTPALRAINECTKASDHQYISVWVGVYPQLLQSWSIRLLRFECINNVVSSTKSQFVRFYLDYVYFSEVYNTCSTYDTTLDFHPSHFRSHWRRHRATTHGYIGE